MMMRILVGLLATQLGIGGLEPSVGSPNEETLEQLFVEGNARYSASDYDAAIDRFSRALELLSLQGGDNEIRGAVLFNLAQAWEKKFAISSHEADLRRARDLYKRYLTESESGFDYPDAEEVMAKLAQVEETLSAGERPAAEVAPTATQAPQIQPKSSEPQSRDRRRSRALIGTGAALAIASAGLFAGMGVGLAQGADAEADGEKRRQDDPDADIDEFQSIVTQGVRANNIALATGITGGVLLAVGVVLLAVGSNRNRRSAASRHRVLRGSYVVSF